MNRITMKTLTQTFLTYHPNWCVSIFMPTHRAGREMEQDPIRFKNMLREVEDGLLAKNMRGTDVQDMLKKPQQLLQDVSFWQRQSDGLAVFFSRETFHFFRLPVTFQEVIVISKRFHVKPLLSLVTSDARFYILALSQNQVRLLEGTRYTADEVPLEGIAQSLSEAFSNTSSEKQLQFHTGTPSGTGKRAAVFYGHDISTETKDRMLRWFRTIDRKLQDILSDDRSPLVLAGVDSLFSIYREANTSMNLMEDGIPGNPEGLKPDALHAQAWTLVEPVFEKTRKEAAARYHRLAGTGQTTTDVSEAVAAACHGRVDVLFAAVGKQVWGHFDPDTGDCQVHECREPGDEDLLDLAAIQSLSKGGAVYAVPPREVPDQALLAAVFRY